MTLAVAFFVILACGGGEERPVSRVATVEQLPAGAVSASEADEHIGSNKTVCGDVKNPTYVPSTPGEPTFLNLDQTYPNLLFLVIIWGDDRLSFPDEPDVLYRDKRICVDGLIGSYKGTPRIEVTSPAQIRIVR